jgi:hypothetical protein
MLINCSAVSLEETSMFPRPNTFSRALVAWLLAAVILCPFVRFAAAQDTLTGAFEGTVTDSRTGQPIARARIEFINQQTGVAVTKLTDSRGRFYQGLLPPGTYTIRASASGYESGETVQRLAGMRTGEVVPVPIVLEPATQSAATQPSPTPATTTPTAADFDSLRRLRQLRSLRPPPRLVDSDSAAARRRPPTTPQHTAAETDVRAGVNAKDASRGGVFNDEEVQSPLGATTYVRTFDELALLLPGVTAPPYTFGNISGPGVGPGVGSAGQFSVNGLPPRANNFTVDGSDNNDEDIGVRRQGFFSLVPQPVESIKEYQVITLLAPAQFGRNIGAQVNAVSKSGGNDVHGDFYGFFNSNQLNARNFFDTEGANGPFAVTSASGRAAVRCANDNATNANCTSGAPITVGRDFGGEDSSTSRAVRLRLGRPRRPAETLLLRERRRASPQRLEGGELRRPHSRAARRVRDGRDRRLPRPLHRTAHLHLPLDARRRRGLQPLPAPEQPARRLRREHIHARAPASARGTILSGKLDYLFRRAERAQQLTGRYNFTNDWRELPATGGALFSTLKPRVRTQNFSLFLNSELSGRARRRLSSTSYASPTAARACASTKCGTRTHMVASRDFPDEPFLLNAPLYTNLTLPNFDAVNNRLVANTGPVIYFDNHATVEDVLGPLGQVTMAGFSPVGVDVFNFPQKRVNNTYQLADQLTLRRGAHNLTFGTDNRRTELNSILPRNFRPLLSFQGEPRLAVGTGGLRISDDFVNASTLAAASAASGFFQTLTTGSDAGHQPSLLPARLLRSGRVARAAEPLALARPPLRVQHARARDAAPHRRHVRRRSLAPVPGLSDLRRRAQAHLRPGHEQLLAAHRRRLVAALVRRAGRDAPARRLRPLQRHHARRGRQPVAQRLPDLPDGEHGGRLRQPSLPASPLEPAQPVRPEPRPRRPGTLNRLNPQTPIAQHVALVNLLARAGGVLPSASGVEATLPARRQQSPDAHHYSFTFEQRFGRDTFLSVAYVGTQASHLPRFTTPNLGTNAVTLLRSFDFELEGEGRFQPEFFGIALQPGTRIGGGRARKGQAFVGGRPVPGVGGIQFFETTASSRYDAMQLELRGRVARDSCTARLHALEDDRRRVGRVRPRGRARAPAEQPDLRRRARPLELRRAPPLHVSRRLRLPALRRTAPRASSSTTCSVAGTGRFQTGQPFTVNSIFDVNLDGNLTDRLDSTNGIVVTGDRSQPLRLTTNDLAALRARRRRRRECRAQHLPRRAATST